MKHTYKKIFKSIVYALIISTFITTGYVIYHSYNLKLKKEASAEFQKGTVIDQKEYSIEEIDKQIDLLLKQARQSPDDPELYYKLGLLYEEKGLINMAVAQWERSAAIKPDNKDYMNDLGRGYFYTGNYEESLKIFKSITTQNSDPKYQINLAYNYYKLGDLKKARLIFENLEEKGPQNFNILASIANIFIEEGNLSQALDYLEKAKKVDSSKASAYFNSGVIYKKLKSPDKALQEFRASFNINNTDSYSLLELGKTYAETGKQDKAIDTWLQAANVGNLASAAVAYNLMGELYYKEGKVSEAIKAFKDSINYDMAYFNAYYNLGNLYYDIGQINPCIENWSKAAKLSPGNNFLNYNLGNAYYDSNNYTKALKYWEYSLNKGLTDPYFNYKASLAYYKTNQLQPALKLANKALRMDSKNIDYREHLGNIYLALGKFDYAISEFKICLQRDPSRTAIYYRTGKAYYNFGEVSEAIKYLYRAINTDKTNYLAYDLLGQIYYKRGGYQQAIAYWREAATLKPDYVDKKSHKAKEYLRKGQYKEAINEFKILLAIEPRNTGLRYDLALCYKASGDIYKALSQLKNIVRLEPDNLKARQTLVDCLLQANNPAEAISNLKYLLNKNPEDMKTLMALSDIYMARNEYDQAIKIYKKALDIKSGDPELLLKYAIGLKLAGYKAGATDRFKQIIDIAPSSPSAQKAKEYINELVESPVLTNTPSIDHSNKLTAHKYNQLIDIGKSQMNKQAYNEAIDTFKEAIRLYPQEKEAFYMMAEILKAKGEPQKASKYYQAYLDRVVKDQESSAQ